MNTTELYRVVEESSHETAFNRLQVDVMSAILAMQPQGGVWVEIGVEYGRSLAVFAQWQKIKKSTLTAIDGWVQENSEEARNHVISQIRKYDWEVDLISKTSQDARKEWQDTLQITVLHIDGDHSYGGVISDVQLWTPLVASGGIIMFDDFGTESLPEVYEAVSDTLFKDSNYQFLGRFADKTGVFKKL